MTSSLCSVNVFIKTFFLQTINNQYFINKFIVNKSVEYIKGLPIGVNKGVHLTPVFRVYIHYFLYDALSRNVSQHTYTLQVLSLKSFVADCRIYSIQ